MIGPARLTTVQIGLAAAAALVGLVVVALARRPGWSPTGSSRS